MFLSVIFCIASLLASGCAKARPPLRALPDFDLTAVTVDRTFPLDRRALIGRVWVADFVYTSCAGPCPLLTANMAELQKRLPKSAGLLSFTVDPDHDSPEVLAAYARKFDADPRRWLFVAGGKSALVRLLRDGFQIPVAESAAAAPGQNIAHATKFVLIDGQARIRGYYDGDDADVLKRLAEDASRL